MERCPKCGNVLMLETTLFTDGAKSELKCNCGYSIRYDPFHNEYRKFNSEYSLKQKG